MKIYGEGGGDCEGIIIKMESDVEGRDSSGADGLKKSLRTQGKLMDSRKAYGLKEN